MNSRFAAVVRESDPDRQPTVKHFFGWPTGMHHEGVREQLPPAKILVLEEDAEGVFLIRYSANGSFAGDTWHGSLQDAKEQASFEFGELLTDWISIADEMSDPVLLVRALSPT